MFTVRVYGTGSKGNCAVISDGECSIMIDAGLKADNITSLVALLITHEHITDHAKYAKLYAERYALQVFATAGTMSALNIPLSMQNIVQYGKTFDINSLTITPFPLSHDAAEPCGFFIENALGETLVWASDTGTMDGLEMEKPADCYVLEANYDEQDIDERLEKGELPYEGLHGRLTSEFGHLSVQQAAAWLKENADEHSHIIVLSPHMEIIGQHMSVFNGLDNVTLPLRYPFSYQVGKVCPF